VNTATRDFNASGLRVSDADRDRAVAELTGHFEAGRLTQDEFGERSSRALQARTEADLAELFADLPTRRAAAPPPQPEPPARDLPQARRPGPAGPFGGMDVSGRLPVVRVVIWVALAIALTGGVSTVAHHSLLVLVVPVLIVIAAIRRLARYR